MQDWCREYKRVNQPRYKRMQVQTIINWPNGDTTMRVINFNNKKHVRQFAGITRTALEKGAQVTTVKMQEHKGLPEITTK